MRSRFALYPVAFALGFVVLIAVSSGVSPFAAIRPLIVTGVVAFAFVVVGTSVFGDRDRGGIFGALAVLALMGGDPRIAVVSLIAVVLLLAERYLVPNERRVIRWPRIGMIASRLVAILLLAIMIMTFQSNGVGLVARAVTHETALRPAPPAPTDPKEPDIYFILLDGRARPDVAERLFGIDPGPLGDGLRDHGFTVAARSRSNYTQTAETLSSMFEQAHLRDIPRYADLIAGKETEPMGGVIRGVFNDNATWRQLRERGYAIEAISSGFEEVSIREADRFVDSGQINEFEIGLLRRSVLADVLKAVGSDFVSAQQRERINSVFRELVAAPKRADDRPTFVFAHVPSPHAPWVFGADGSPRTVADLEALYADTPATTGLSNEVMAPMYAGQVMDTDRRFLEALDGLDTAIAARGRPAVTVVFSDHGTWIGANDGDIRLRFKNLLAVRGDGVDVSVEPDLTLVNLLPSLSEQLFGEPWIRRDDTTYAFGARDIFDLVPVDDPDARSSP